ncbi:glutamine synthetase family protein [Taklimakanibacter deserti]|uniref:glutamine synthetase family protein n=1 Tax=Taklimakanibacter deserti TaxID=2267839 RepID=UPI000E659DD2
MARRSKAARPAKESRLKSGADGETVLLVWTDYVGLARCRGVPVSAFKDRHAHGLGWAVAGQALTPFEDIAPNPWGPMTEVRQTPVLATETRIAIWDDAPAFHFALCDSLIAGQSWDCCVRGFLKKALADLERESGLTIAAAFEHEFLLTGNDLPWIVPFSVEQMRVVAPFTADLTRALLAADVGLETVEPEYGVCQYEISCGPAIGIAGADRAVIAREVIREAARRKGFRASFTPKPTPSSVGNGAHVHFSLVDSKGVNRTFDAKEPATLSRLAQHFTAGVVRYMPEFCALVAPSPVSYLRLGPHHWSCGYAAFGIQNREATIRSCPSPDPKKNAKAFNLELRPPDATASPYMVLGALVRAGLEGIRQKLPLPAILDRDPADYSDKERAKLGVRTLPSSLGEALDLMRKSEVVSSWLPDLMRESYVAVKRKEIEMFADATPEAMCKRYHDAY